MVPVTGRTYTPEAQSEHACLRKGDFMNKTFACLTAAAVVALASSLAAAQASAVVLAPEVRTVAHRHVVTPYVAPLRVPVVGPVVGPVVRPRVGATVVAPLRGPVVHPRARGRAIIRR